MHQLARLFFTNKMITIFWYATIICSQQKSVTIMRATIAALDFHYNLLHFSTCILLRWKFKVRIFIVFAIIISNSHVHSLSTSIFALDCVCATFVSINFLQKKLLHRLHNNISKLLFVSWFLVTCLRGEYTQHMCILRVFKYYLGCCKRARQPFYGNVLQNG